MQQSLLAAERTAETRRRRVRSNGMVGYRYDAAVNGTNAGAGHRAASFF